MFIESKVKKYGNSIMITIPSLFAKNFGLKPEQTIRISKQDSKTLLIEVI